MFSRKTNDPNLSPEQHMMLETAQRRIRQKKRLYRHTVIFLVGCVFLLVINKILKYGEAYEWYLWTILAWGFFLILHFVNVFITQKFMGENWERKQREILVSKQRDRIAEIQKEIETEFPLGQINKKKEPWEPSP